MLVYLTLLLTNSPCTCAGNELVPYLVGNPALILKQYAQ